ncbi:MAG TPA: GYD domain-containing protein [Acidimicrobiales bacterium]|nr:GYD domain-containing protein [Acidimicrobiales bacterium]
MPRYLIKANYTLEGIKALKAHGGSVRRQAVEDAVKSVGGTLESFYYAFGDDDVYVIAELPGNVDAAAVGLATCAGGGAQTRTVVLLTPEEMDQASRREVGYRPPS